METAQPFGADRSASLSDFTVPPQPSYPTVRLLLRHGRAVAAAVGLLPLLGALWAVAAGWPAGLIVAGLVAAAVVYLLMRSYVELVSIIADMLLPR